jgi:hypothetical protein
VRAISFVRLSFLFSRNQSSIHADYEQQDSAMLPSALAGTKPRISFAAQAAVISKLVHQAADGSAHTFVHL